MMPPGLVLALCYTKGRAHHLLQPTTLAHVPIDERVHRADESLQPQAPLRPKVVHHSTPTMGEQTLLLQLSDGIKDQGAERGGRHLVTPRGPRQAGARPALSCHLSIEIGALQQLPLQPCGGHCHTPTYINFGHSCHRTLEQLPRNSGSSLWHPDQHCIVRTQVATPARGHAGS